MNILIIDNQEIVVEELSFILKQAYCVDNLYYASDGFEAVELAESVLADLILLDLSMTGNLDGFATLEKLRKLLPEAKIVIFTIDDNLDYQKKAYEAEADGYLIKPLNRDAIINSLDQILASFKVFNADVITAVSEQ